MHFDCVGGYAGVTHTIVSGSNDNTLKIWNDSSGDFQCIQTLTGHTKVSIVDYRKEVCILT